MAGDHVHAVHKLGLARELAAAYNNAPART